MSPKGDGRWAGTLEVCIDRVDAVNACVQGGADRIELCASLDIGGITPSRGMMRALRDAPLPVHVLIRPRGGNFIFGAREVQAMRDDIAAVADAGLAGVVIGAATPTGQLDLPTMTRLLRAAQGLETTLHRVVDTLNDPLLAVDQAIEAGMVRVLGSGGQPNAVDGASTLMRMVQRAAGRVQVMAGGGLRARDVAYLAQHAGVRHFHASCRVAVPADPLLTSLGFCTAEDRACGVERVRAYREAIDSCAGVHAM